MASTTIYITPARKITSASLSVTPLSTTNMATVREEGGQPVRKRQRLTHLTPEEKLMRRKLKNRVAAQTARDRKKALMGDLELRLAQVESKNQELLKTNEMLRKQSIQLADENKKLKAQLRLQPPTVNVKQEKDSNDPAVCELDTGCESAVLSVPPQQELIRVLSSWMTMLALLSLSSYLGYYTNSTQKDSSQKETSQTQVLNPSTTTVQPILSWWGPQQGQLESIKELIRFDHEYYKKPVEGLNVTDKDSTPKQSTTVPEKEQPDTQVPDLVVSLDTEPVLMDIPDIYDNVEGFNCDLTDLLNVESTRHDSYSDSGISDTESTDFPASPLTESNDWQDTFTDLFPSLGMV
uniref:X-box-binding protein 1 n=1 Tax=Ptychodera flava TaxID=63121 RepID=A0A0D3S0J5_PTYFL|nr:X-box binding protein 1 [Ptychodera flava]